MPLQMRTHFALSLFLIATFTSFSASAQNQSSLDFDGIDDKVRVIGAVDLVSGSSEVSLACWASLSNPAPGFPDFDGILGFRNDFSADFYLLQLSATEIEARFRNSNNEEFTIVHNGDFQGNVWQHFTLTYDGALLRFFINGNQVDSLAANGTLANAGTDLSIGYLDYQAFTFGMTGKIDEVGLWNRTLSAEEINCIIDTKISLASQGLQVYLDFNDGQADGDNTAIPALIDQASGSSTTISDMALTGTTSNFTSGVNNYTTVNSTYCGTAFSFGSQIIDAPGIYYDAFLVAGACDSLVALNVTDNSPDVSVTSNNNYLLANAANANYQWVNCSTNTLVSGAVNQAFIPSANGEYAVIITQNFCSDTSDCINFTTAGFENLIVQELQISPNPAQEFFQISLPFWATNAELEVFDITGKKVLSELFTGNQAIIDRDAAITPGLYFAVVNLNGNRFSGKIVLY
jgi:hypothetical protein